MSAPLAATTASAGQVWDTLMVAAPTVTIVDDEPGVRATLERFVLGHGLTCATHESAEAFLNAPVGSGGCVVADINLPDMNGISLVRTMEMRGLLHPVIVMTGRADIDIAVQAMKEGAVDFLAKPFDRATFLEKVTAGLVLHRARVALSARRCDAARRLASLTGRESQVLDLVIEGKQNKAIAWELGISIKTVEVHRAHIMEKTGAASAIALARLWEAAQRDEESGSRFAAALPRVVAPREAARDWGRP